MYDIEALAVSDEFARCWQAAGQHIEKQVQDRMTWLKAHLPLFLEHLSFRLGNQLFFVRIEDADGGLEIPGSREGLLHIADGCKGHACLLPMRHEASTWAPTEPGWGLLDLRTGRAIDPLALVSDELIEMTDWELQDFAVQVVRDDLRKKGRELMSWQGNPSLDPSIWFAGDRGPEWVVVRAVRYPEKKAAPPDNWHAIAEKCARLGKTGHFASVAAASADHAFHPDVQRRRFGVGMR